MKMNITEILQNIFIFKFIKTKKTIVNEIKTYKPVTLTCDKPAATSLW